MNSENSSSQIDAVSLRSCAGANVSSTPAVDDDARIVQHLDTSFPIPIMACVFEPSQQRFRVTRSKGNTLHSGGYGVVMPREDNTTLTNSAVAAEEHVIDEPEKSDMTSSDPDTIRAGNSTYLFIEEVLVLHQQGYLEVKDESGSIYDTRQLFDLLEPLGVALPVYLVYAHLRQQTYRVVRHTTTRRAILQQLQPYYTGAASMNQVRCKELKRCLRLDIASAPAPRMAGSESSTTAAITPAFDVYQPNAHFAKTCPGLPDFSVAVTSYQHCPCRFDQWHNMLSSGFDTTTTTLKVAAVSESGTVLVFGVTKVGVPAIPKQDKSNLEETVED
jgi:hypothetical protein